jgi:hypothetical protein
MCFDMPEVGILHSHFHATLKSYKVTSLFQKAVLTRLSSECYGMLLDLSLAQKATETASSGNGTEALWQSDDASSRLQCLIYNNNNIDCRKQQQQQIMETAYSLFRCSHRHAMPEE